MTKKHISTKNKKFTGICSSLGLVVLEPKEHHTFSYHRPCSENETFLLPFPPPPLRGYG